MLLPQATNMLFGPVLASGDGSILPHVCALLVGVAVAQALIRGMKSLVMQGVGRKLSLHIEAAAMMRVLALPASFFRRHAAGELATLLGGFSAVAGLLQSAVLGTALSALFSLVYLVQICAMAPALALPALAVAGANLAVTVAGTLLQMRVSRRALAARADLNGWQNSLLDAVKDIRAAGAEERAWATWARRYARPARLTYNGPLAVRLVPCAQLAVSLLGTVAVYGAAVAGGVSVAQYMAFASAFGMVTGAFAGLSAAVGSFAQIRAYLQAIAPILDAVPERSAAKQPVEKLAGAVELRDVRFSYDGAPRPVLDGLNLSIPAGSYVALVGDSGCGKSTVMRLMLGFEQPQAGAVLFDGRDLRNLDLQSLRRHIGVVLQQTQLFAGDIYANIVVAAPWLTEEDAWRAAEAAGIADDIRALPMGMRTVVAAGGAGFSGGQRQRLAIARALAPSPQVLIFDEATSALDNHAQRVVAETLDGLTCTRIVIAHRISTIRTCDRIVMLKGGAVAEQGTYEELMAARGPFYELVRRQEL